MDGNYVFDGSNDIALLILAEKVNLTEHIQTACLPSKNLDEDLDVKSQLYAMGWGGTTADTRSTSTLTIALKNTKLKVYESSVCSLFDDADTKDKICTGKSFIYNHFILDYYKSLCLSSCDVNCSVEALALFSGQDLMY